MMLDHRHDNVRVCSIMPGSVDTEFSGRSGKRSGDTSWMIAPEDVAEVGRPGAAHAGANHDQPDGNAPFASAEVSVCTREAPLHKFTVRSSVNGPPVALSRSEMALMGLGLDRGEDEYGAAEQATGSDANRS